MQQGWRRGLSRLAHMQGLCRATRQRQCAALVTTSEAIPSSAWPAPSDRSAVGRDVWEGGGRKLSAMEGSALDRWAPLASTDGGSLSAGGAAVGSGAALGAGAAPSRRENMLLRS